MMSNLNGFCSLCPKKRNSHGHPKCMKNHKIIHRNCCSGVITLCSPKHFWVIFCPSSTVICRIIFLTQISQFLFLNYLIIPTYWQYYISRLLEWTTILKFTAYTKNCAQTVGISHRPTGKPPKFYEIEWLNIVLITRKLKLKIEIGSPV